MKFPFLIPLAALFVVPGGVVRAEQADRNKPMQVEADRMQHDEPRQLTLLTGKVQAVKGTLIMRAARMEVQQDAQGQQVVRFWAEPGQRVFFRQKREGLDEFIEGEAVRVPDPELPAPGVQQNRPGATMRVSPEGVARAETPEEQRQRTEQQTQAETVERYRREELGNESPDAPDPRI